MRLRDGFHLSKKSQKLLCISREIYLDIFSRNETFPASLISVTYIAAVLYCGFYTLNLLQKIVCLLRYLL